MHLTFPDHSFWYISMLFNLFQFSGASRLQDAIVLGYQLQSAAGKDISIPDWYNLATNELSLHTTLPTIETNKPTCITEVSVTYFFLSLFYLTLNLSFLLVLNLTKNSFVLNWFLWLLHFLSDRCADDFEILHGDIQGFSDTASFLKSLARLDASYDSGKNAKCQMREHVAAATLFNWEVFCKSCGSYFMSCCLSCWSAFTADNQIWWWTFAAEGCWIPLSNDWLPENLKENGEEESTEKKIKVK